LFLVVKGKLLIRLRDRDIQLDEGEFVVIPRGVEHLPIAKEEAHVLLLEPKSTNVYIPLATLKMYDARRRGGQWRTSVDEI
jgi:quercetin dioxygenase-like cupin family protein